MRWRGTVLVPLVLGVAVLTAAVAAAAERGGGAGSAVATVPVLAAESAVTAPATWPADSLRGRSGKVWLRLVSAERSEGIGVLRRLFGDSALERPGVYTARDSATGRAFTVATLLPFAAKRRGVIGSYRLGLWPGERRSAASGPYANPPGFIPVTPESQDTRVSEHFRLRDFLTKDQPAVWPKYLVLSEALLDKLELVIASLSRRGVPADRVVVMSGFRTPQYNARGVGSGGRAENSRHQYGDAADIFVDADGDGRMDDLNRDGRVNTSDARFLAQVVESVERDHPALVGGVGVYQATSAHGPFVHVDVRGVRARWGLF